MTAAVTSTQHLRLCLFGAPGSNTNLGLGALMQGTLAGIRRAAPDSTVSVFDNQLGVRRGAMELEDGPLAYELIGARLSRRVTRPESYAAMNASRLFRGLGNPGMRAMLRSAAVLDVSGGDSFSDIYGEHRFRTVCAPKQLALRARRPLVLLPQTYGPFGSPKARDAARRLIVHAQQAWARDMDSFEVLQDLLGPDFDATRHRLGVDLALLLPPRPPAVSPALALATSADADGPLVGVNVSGLLWNRPEPFGLTIDYRMAMIAIVQRLLDIGARVVLVPHVLGRRADGEADNLAGDALVSALPAGIARRVHTVPWFDDAGQAKWVISRCDWFLGTRMHSTIAALSSGVPAAAVAYSAKYAGVFDTFGARDEALDARNRTTAQLVEEAVASFTRRDSRRSQLAPRAEAAIARAEQQMGAIVGSIRGT